VESPKLKVNAKLDQPLQRARIFFAALHHALNYRDDLSNVKRFGALQQFIFDDSNQVVSAQDARHRA
jgi:hypothetical protein